MTQSEKAIRKSAETFIATLKESLEALSTVKSEKLRDGLMTHTKQMAKDFEREIGKSLKTKSKKNEKQADVVVE